MKATISQQTLVARCEWVMRRNEKLLLANGCIDADFYFGRGEGELLYQQRLDLLGPLMNNGQYKEVIFAVTRLAVEEAGYDCMIFASDTFRFVANERYLALSNEQRHELTDRGFKKLEAQGYGRACEAITVTGQTPEHSVMLTRPYFRDAINPDKVFRIGAEERMVGSIDDYAGRSKMWGDWREPGMRAAYERVKKIGLKAGLDNGAALRGSATLVNIAVEA